MKKNLIATLAIFAYSSLFSINVLFAYVDVDASLPTGTYDKVIKVELNSTDAASKIFYTFKPNGTPDDIFRYSGPIMIKASTQLAYWTFISTDNESKIKENIYTLIFPNDIKLGTGAMFEDSVLKNVSLTNISASPIDVSYWEARNDGGKVVVPDGTMLAPGQNYDVIGLSGTGIISLFSPDEEKKDFMEVQVINKEVALISPEKPATIKKTAYIPRKVAKIPKNTTTDVAMIVPDKTTEVKPADISVAPPAQAPSNENTGSSANLSPNGTGANPPAQEPINNDFNNSIKASTQESQNSGNSNGKFIIIGVMAIAALGGAGMKFAKKKN